MKKSNYLWLALVAFVFYCCSSDSIIPEEESVVLEIEIEESVTTTQPSKNETSKRNDSNTTNTNGQQNSNSTARGGTGFEDNDGNIYDGDNTNDSPSGYQFNYSITYTAGITETRKRELRVPYQIAGELLYFERCPNNPQKEIWYMVYSSTTSNCSTITFPDGSQVMSCPLTSNSDDANPPRDFPELRHPNTTIDVFMLPTSSQDNCN